MAANTAKSSPGVKRIGRYVLRKRLGNGMHGTVFLAQDPHLGRDVAIKLLKIPEGQSSLSFPSEVRAVGRLRHPNVVSVYDVGHVGTAPYLVFEYVDGETLWDLLTAPEPIAMDRAVELIGQVLDGLAHAHAHGVVHLDLSPRNVIIGPEGRAMVMDFGLARLMDAPIDGGDEVMGTLLYMSPEHLSREGLGPWSDVYSIGLILFELLARRSAVAAGRVSDVLRRVAAADVDMKPLTDQGVDPSLVHCIIGALRADPQTRYRDAGTMRAALQDWLESRTGREHESTQETEHATVAFLLRRMQRKKDFPALSQSLLQINKLSAPDSRASAAQLSNVILRDYALTNKLLKLANSAFYGPYKGKVNNVSSAVRVLGFEQVRLAANSLTFFNHLQDDSTSAELHDALIASFMAGLVTRHLARVARLPDAESAFIAGLFQQLGKVLTLYYFPDDDADIVETTREHGLDPDEAARTVLGISYSELGIAVGKRWGFPGPLLACIRGIETSGEVETEDDEQSALRNRAVFANTLCTLPTRAAEGSEYHELCELAEAFEERLGLDVRECLQLLEQVLVKVTEHSSTLGMQVEQSDLVARTREFVRIVALHFPPEDEGAEEEVREASFGF